MIIFTFNGFFLPGFLIKNKLVLSKKEIKHFPYQIFRRRNVLYYSKEYKTGYISYYNKNRFFKELFLCLKLAIEFILKIGYLKKEYRYKSSKLMSEKFWRKVYQNKN